jgi:hypothetical protein
MARSAILRRDNPGPLLFRHDAIGLCPGLHLIDLFLLRVQSPTRNPLIDPLFLIRLPLIQQGYVDLGKDHPGREQYYSTDREQPLLHHRLPQTWKLDPLASDNVCGNDRSPTSRSVMRYPALRAGPFNKPSTVPWIYRPETRKGTAAIVYPHIGNYDHIWTGLCRFFSVFWYLKSFSSPALLTYELS